MIEDARANPVPGKEDVALYAFAQATDLDGNLLPIEVAAVELLNIIRPTVALTVWAALMGHALFSRPDLKQQLKMTLQNFKIRLFRKCVVTIHFSQCCQQLL